MVFFPPCKINLGLNIVSRRTDGFHNIDTCFYPVPWTDVLELIPSSDFSFSMTGLPVVGVSSENLCVKAYRLMAEEFNLPPVKMHLHKVIPMGAGLGGGSSDAAYVIIALNEIFNLKMPKEEMATRASKLGSDCAFFIYSQPMIGTEKGEKLSPVSVDLKGRWLVIVKPPIHVSTAEAYAGVTPGRAQSSISETITKVPVVEWKNVLINDFEKTVFIRHPEIRQIKDQLYQLGAVYASMSGSGSAVYGIFDSPIHPANGFSGATYWMGRLG